MGIKTSFSFIVFFIFSSIYLLANNVNIENVEGYIGNNKSTLIGIVKNQSWVTSKVLNESGIKNIIDKYPDFKIIKYDSLYGILIEYNHLDNSVLEDLEKLKMEEGIYRVFNRVYEGKNAFKIYSEKLEEKE